MQGRGNVACLQRERPNNGIGAAAGVCTGRQGAFEHTAIRPGNGAIREAGDRHRIIETLDGNSGGRGGKSTMAVTDLVGKCVLGGLRVAEPVERVVGIIGEMPLRIDAEPCAAGQRDLTAGRESLAVDRRHRQRIALDVAVRARTVAGKNVAGNGRILIGCEAIRLGDRRIVDRDDVDGGDGGVAVQQAIVDRDRDMAINSRRRIGRIGESDGLQGQLVVCQRRRTG